MDPSDSAAIVRWLGGHFKCAALAVYEQLNPGDAFGRQMCSHLEGRGCPLRGVYSTPTKEAHEARMTGNGWGAARCRTMDELYMACLDPADKARIEALEMFDEFEEWHMMMDHYCITVAVNSGASSEGSGGVLAGFGLQDVPQPPLPGPRLPLVD
jgi:tRNA wybutosine-synthesizing protein 4